MPKMTIAERKAKLEAELKAVKELEAQERDARRMALGTALEAAMAQDANFAATVMKALDPVTKAKKQRELIGLKSSSGSKDNGT